MTPFKKCVFMGREKRRSRILSTSAIPVLLMRDISNTLMTIKAVEYLNDTVEKVDM